MLLGHRVGVLQLAAQRGPRYRSTCSAAAASEHVVGVRDVPREPLVERPYCSSTTNHSSRDPALAAVLGRVQPAHQAGGRCAASRIRVRSSSRMCPPLRSASCSWGISSSSTKRRARSLQLAVSAGSSSGRLRFSAVRRAHGSSLSVRGVEPLEPLALGSGRASAARPGSPSSSAWWLLITSSTISRAPATAGSAGARGVRASRSTASLSQASHRRRCRAGRGARPRALALDLPADRRAAGAQRRRSPRAAPARAQA